MDPSGVPKKVIRHVEKAIRTLRVPNRPLKFSEVLAEVKYTMRNLVPVKDLENVVKICYQNLKKQHSITPNDSEENLELENSDESFVSASRSQ